MESVLQKAQVVGSLARLLETLGRPNPDDADDDWGPFGPYVRAERGIWKLVGRHYTVRELHPPPVDTEGPVPQPWAGRGIFTQRVTGTLVGRALAERFVTIAQITQVAPDGERILKGHLEQLVDDLCGTPPRLRWPLPVPWPGPKKDPRVAPQDLVAIGIQLFTAGERIGDAGIAAQFAAAGERLAQVGLERLAR
jgi:hypothetical protein